MDSFVCLSPAKRSAGQIATWPGVKRSQPPLFPLPYSFFSLYGKLFEWFHIASIAAALPQYEMAESSAQIPVILHYPKWALLDRRLAIFYRDRDDVTGNLK